MLPTFEFHSAPDLNSCLDVMASESDIAPIAGGTNLVADMRGGRLQPKSVIDIWPLADLAYIRRDNGHVVIGGRSTLTDVLESTLLPEAGGQSLIASAEIFASPLIRNRATVAGNLADASPAADLAPPLLALNAEVMLRSKHGLRTLPLEEFFLGPRQTVRQADELLAEIRYELPPAGAYDKFLKLGLRWEDAISLVSVAVHLELDGDVCQTARIALGAVAPRPIRAKNAEAILVGERFTEESIRQAASIASAEDATPISDVRGSAEYRRWMVEVMVRRALLLKLKEME